MKLTQLKSLVKHGESEILEFKSSTGSLTAGMQTVCAFLNSNTGGTIIFGVKDDGQITGQIVTDKTKKDIGIELNKIEPHAKIDVIYVPVGADKKAIVFRVNPGEKQPYTYDDRAFTRNQSTTSRMSKEEYSYLYNKYHPTTWESLANNTCKISDLDGKLIKEVVRLGIAEKRLPESARKTAIPQILKKLELMHDAKLTNAAVILFCKNEDKQFFQSHIKLARFRGTDKKEFLDHKYYKGNVFDLYDKAMAFLHFILPVGARIEPGNPIRVETPIIPYNVLREAVTNALIHRDYSHAGGSIDIAVYDDRINISNIGALPPGVSLRQLFKEHRSIPRNPRIANVFYVCGKIEKWGRGTLDMIQDCKNAGNPPPIFEEVGGSFSLTLPFKEPMSTILHGQKRTEKISLTTRQKKIIEALQEGPLNRQQIMDQVKTSLTDRGMQLELAKLKSMGLIDSEGKGKAILWYLT
jgi:ATP-dependent DNA helicase RecG